MEDIKITRELMKEIYLDKFINLGEILYVKNFYYLYDKPSPTKKRHYIYTSRRLKDLSNLDGMESKVRTQRELDHIIEQQYYVSRYDYDGVPQFIKKHMLNKILKNL